MRTISTPRQGGKTSQILRWMREAPLGEHRVIVSATMEEAMQLLRDNQDLESWQFVSMNELCDSNGTEWSGVLMGRGGRIVLAIDNADRIIANSVRFWPVEIISFSEET